jgi:hypothetical protein
MIRHYLVTALRNVAANWFHSAITIGGLAIGLMADETTFWRNLYRIPNGERTILPW